MKNLSKDSSVPTVGTFIDLRRNHAFKLIFGSKGNEDLLLALINAILPEKGITSVELEPTENMGIREDARSSVFDVTCHTSSGDFVSVEMQFREQDDFNERMVFYSSFTIFNSLTKGGRSYAFQSPIYIIGVLNFVLPTVESNQRIINRYRLRNLQDGNIELTRNLTYITLELPKFTKQLDELESQSDKLIYTIAHISEMKELPKSFSGKVLEKLFEMCSFANMTREQQHEYIRSIMAEIDVRSQVRTAEEKAEAKGKAELVKAMRDKGLPISTITDISGLSEAQIMAL